MGKYRMDKLSGIVIIENLSKILWEIRGNESEINQFHFLFRLDSIFVCNNRYPSLFSCKGINSNSFFDKLHILCIVIFSMSLTDHAII